MRFPVLLPLILLILLHIAILLAGFFAPYAPDRQNRAFAFAPPTQVHFIDERGQFHFRPFVYELRLRSDGQYAENRSTRFPVRFFSSGDSYRVAFLWSSRLHLFSVDNPAGIFLMGTDDYGRDQLSRFIWGGQVSLLAGPLAAALALAIGATLGGLSGYYGGPVDLTVMTLTDIFLALPWFYLLLGVRAVLPLELEPRSAFLVLVCVLGAIGWARPARMVRGVVLSAKGREFVLAARAFGASDFYLLRHHILPQTRGVLLAQLALLVPQYILAEVTMSFLGLGVNEPAASWGLMLANLQQYHGLASYWWMWLPAMLTVPVFLAYYALAASVGQLNRSPFSAAPTHYRRGEK